MGGLGVRGNYLLNLKFGERVIAVDPSTIREFTIIQEMNKFLPFFRLNVADSSGTLTHTTPFDRGMSSISIEIGKTLGDTPDNSFDFTVFRRFPESQFGASADYEINGLLNIADPLFGPDYCRGWDTMTIKQIIEYIALTELGCDATDVSPSLEYTKQVVQPHWSNGQLLADLARRVMGEQKESGYVCFIRRKGRKSTLVFRSMTEFVKQSPVVAKFIINDEPFEDYLPVYDYGITDNYKLFGIMGSKRQEYQYFDYFNSQYVKASTSVDDVHSLTRYHLIDGNDPTNSDTITRLGRSNEFTRTFEDRVRGTYHPRVMNLMQMWVLVWGNSNIMPGDLVSILFGQGISSGNIASYQYSGNWMVQKVISMFSDTYMTRLLLVRNGIETDQKTSLVKAAKVRR